MKKLITPIAICAIAGILFSSCSNLSMFSMTKRHFRRGYYVDHGIWKKPFKDVTRTSLVNLRKAHVNSVATRSKNSSGTNNIAAIAPERHLVIARSVERNSNKGNRISEKGNKGNYPVTQNTAANITTGYEYNYIAMAVTAPAVAKEGSAHATNAPFWLVVVCAIFIPPLGVYLEFGIGTKFWIDLILTLLFFFPGMIYALIVVLSD